MNVLLFCFTLLKKNYDWGRRGCPGSLGGLIEESGDLDVFFDCLNPDSGSCSLDAYIKTNKNKPSGKCYPQKLCWHL